jgi:hypothetical protein
LYTLVLAKAEMFNLSYHIAEFISQEAIYYRNMFLLVLKYYIYVGENNQIL